MSKKILNHPDASLAWYTQDIRLAYDFPRA